MLGFPNCDQAMLDYRKYDKLETFISQVLVLILVPFLFELNE